MYFYITVIKKNENLSEAHLWTKVEGFGYYYAEPKK